MRKSVTSTFGSRKSVRLSDRIAAGQLVAKERRAAKYASVRGMGYSPVYGRTSMQEVKFFDCVVTATGATGLPGIATPPTGAEPVAAFIGITELNCVQQGATAYNRIGTKIQIKSIQVAGTFVLSGANPQYMTARYMIVYDQQPNGAFPAITDLLSTNISTAPSFTTGVNMANRSRFTVLRDRYVDFDKDRLNQIHFKEFIRCGLESQFRTNAGNVGDLTTGAIYFVAFTHAAGAADNNVALQTLTSRIRYYD